MSELDQAHAAMANGDEAGLLRFYQILADATLFILLEREAEGERVDPKIFDLPDGPVLLAFDSEERLAAWGQGPLPYAALPGRIIAQHLSGTGVSLGLNFGSDAASETLLPPEAMRWLSEMLETAPAEMQATPARFFAPQDVPDALIDALTFTLSGATGLVSAALLAGVRYDDGRLGHVLALIDAHPAAQEALARAMSEALSFSGLEAGELDVTFLNGGEPAVSAMAAVARVFDIPWPETVEPAQSPTAPGMNPDRPPVLR
jgi:hypothetical protein